MLDGLAFIGSYQSPPDYPCGVVGGCLRGAALEWTCGPFSRVRAMRRMGALLSSAGLDEIARLCSSSGPGHVESRINEELARVPYRDDPERWFQLESLKMKARNIRKWRIEP